ncbi:MAG: hypothetical protein AB1642_08465 [Pseudomonadota bacterium]
MQYRNVPFAIVLLASVLPWVAAAANSKMVTYAPDALAILAYIWLIVRHPLKAGGIHFNFAMLFLFAGVHVLFGVASGRGVGSGGLVSLLVLAFIFNKLMEQESSPRWANAIARQIGIVYIIHVIFILGELIFRLAGYTDILVAIAGQVPDQIPEVKKYKTYNSAMFLNYLGVENISGMNSLLLGSQSASQLVLLAAFYFFPWYKGRHLMQDGLSHGKWFLLSIALFPFVASMTAMVILVVLLFFLIYFLPNSGLNKPILRIATPLLLLIFGAEILSVVAFRISKAAHVDIYMNAFMASPNAFLELSLLDQLMGFGSNLRNADVAAADFGFGMLLYQVGILLLGFILASFALLIYSVRINISRHAAAELPWSQWTTIAAINIVCAIGWAVSLIHYTPAVELGGRHIFAMHLAVCLIALKKMRVGGLSLTSVVVAR